MVQKINPAIEELSKKQDNLPEDIDSVITDYFQVWNYKVGYEACEQLRGSTIELELKSRAPFWVTMARHERWPVAIMLIN